MDAPRSGDRSRKLAQSSPARSSPVDTSSRSPSPHAKRSRRDDRSGETRRRDGGDRDSRGRDMGDRYRERKKVEDMDRSRDRDERRDRGDRGRESNRERISSRQPERSRYRGREREPEERLRGRTGGKDGPIETSPMPSSPRRKPPDRSLSPSPQHSPPKRRGSKSERTTIDDDEARRERNRGDDGSAQPDDALTRTQEVEAALEKNATNKEKLSFEYSGKLAAETNKVRGVTLQFTEPAEARKPTTRWRLYVFKDGEPLDDPLYIHRQTCYLFGRERRVADVPTDHPSCSKQHAVIQYRLTEKEDSAGFTSDRVRPYVMDLGSTNGTFLNGKQIDSQRYYEMFEKDTIKFGNSSREYVLLHEHSMG